MPLFEQALCSLTVFAVYLTCTLGASGTLPKILLAKNSPDPEAIRSFRAKPEILKFSSSSGYFGRISVGTPPQHFNVSFDTTTSCFFLTSANCACSDQCDPKAYNYISSSTYRGTRNEIPSSDGTPPDGYNTTDTLQVAGARLKNQPFREASCLSLSASFVHGILGLAQSDNCKGFQPIIRRMLAKRQISRPIVSTWFKRSKTSTAKHDGEIIFGGIEDSRFKGRITYTPNLDPSGWAVKVDSITGGIQKNNITACQKGCTSIISTQIQYIGGPVDEIVDINQKIFGVGATIVQVDCPNNESSLPTIDFKISGKKFRIRGDDYVVRFDNDPDGSICLSAFVTNVFFTGDQNAWVFGTSFLKTVYTVFDFGKNRVGFAKSSQNIKGEHYYPWETRS